jgi:hypothetical protein
MRWYIYRLLATGWTISAFCPGNGFDSEDEAYQKLEALFADYWKGEYAISAISPGIPISHWLPKEMLVPASRA